MLQDFLKPGIPLREAAPNVYSVFEPGDDGAAYDSKAAAYDRAVSSNLYLSVAWGVTRAAFAGFINDALKALHAAGEVSAPRTALEVTELLSKGMNAEVRHQVKGNFVFVRGQRRETDIA